jgi:hypothetical protein
MLDESLKTTKKRLVAATLIAVMLSGCAQTTGWLDSVRDGDSDASDEPVNLGAPAADDYLDELSGLSSDDPALQAEIFADSQAAAQLTPNPSTTLRYALALATPGHPGSDPQQAQSILRELMTQTAVMTTAEVALATIPQIARSAPKRRPSISAWPRSRPRTAVCGRISRTRKANSMLSPRSSVRFAIRISSGRPLNFGRATVGARIGAQSGRSLNQSRFENRSCRECNRVLQPFPPEQFLAEALR